MWGEVPKPEVVRYRFSEVLRRWAEARPGTPIDESERLDLHAHVRAADAVMYPPPPPPTTSGFAVQRYAMTPRVHDEDRRWWNDNRARVVRHLTKSSSTAASQERKVSDGDDFRNASWFSEATGEGIYSKLLQEARKAGRLSGAEKRGARWFYSVCEVKRQWPEYAEAIDKHLVRTP